MTALSVEMWATLATALIGLAVIVLEYLKTRSPNQEVADKLDDLERRISQIEGWKNS